MSTDHPQSWWRDESNYPDILIHPGMDGGLAAYRNQRSELVLLQFNASTDEDDMILVPAAVMRSLVERIVGLFPELTEPPAPPVVVQPPRQLAIAGPQSRRPVDVPLPLAGAAKR